MHFVMSMTKDVIKLTEIRDASRSFVGFICDVTKQFYNYTNIVCFIMYLTWLIYDLYIFYTLNVN